MNITETLPPTGNSEETGLWREEQVETPNRCCTIFKNIRDSDLVVEVLSLFRTFTNRY